MMKKTAIPFIVDYLLKFKLRIALLIFFIVFGNIGEQYTLYLLAHIFELVGKTTAEHPYWSEMAKYLLYALGIALANVVMGFLGFWITAKLVPFMRSLVIKDAFDYVNKHSIAYFNNEMSGNISNKVSLLQNGVADVLQALTNACFHFLFIIVNLVILFVINVYLGLLTFLWATVASFISIKLGKKGRYSLKKAEKSRAMPARWLLMLLQTTVKLKALLTSNSKD